MRSVFLHFPASLEERVRECLDRAAMRLDGDKWCLPSREEPRLWCAFGAEFGDWEPSELEALRRVLPDPSAFVQVDVSGTIPGDVEVRRLALELMESIPEVVATDDDSDHAWSAAEIRDGVLIEGRPFFDTRREER